MSRCLADGCSNKAARFSHFCSDECLLKDDAALYQKSDRNQTIDRIRDNLACAHDLQAVKEIIQYEILPLLED